MEEQFDVFLSHNSKDKPTVRQLAEALQRRSKNNWRNPGFAQTDDHPVVCVSWNDAMAYVDWLNKQTGQMYRLPTEAEWEYADRAGTQTAYWWGVTPGSNRANCDGCGSRWDNKQTAPVGSFSANPFGLYDMAGNVWEWTCSEYDPNYGGKELSCTCSETSGPCVLRGGSWSSVPRRLRGAARLWFNSRGGYLGGGFRLART
jgi:formylglycine-generating enzyme required for sulfatase activity